MCDVPDPTQTRVIGTSQQFILVNIMSNATKTRNARSNASKTIVLHDAHVQTRDANATTNANSVVTLKSIIAQHNIKTDPKLIRRVLRKYHAMKNNHQHRDAWTFPVNQIDDVVKLINEKCRAGKSA